MAEAYNKPYYYLRNDDIKGSKPSVSKFVTSRKSGNPLTPQYKQASYEPVEPLETKFIRNSMLVDVIFCYKIEKDIDGAKSKKLHKDYDYDSVKKSLNKCQESNYIDDISGSRPTIRYSRTKPLNPLDVKDINEFRIFRSDRVTNPLKPIYNVVDDENRPITIGPVDGSTSTIQHPNIVNKEMSSTLNSKDIFGGQVSTTGNPYMRSRV